MFLIEINIFICSIRIKLGIDEIQMIPSYTAVGLTWQCHSAICVCEGEVLVTLGTLLDKLTLLAQSVSKIHIETTVLD